MRLLLDTQVVIWWLQDRRLSEATRQAVRSAPMAFVSSVSLWEIVIKQGLGRLELPVAFDEAVRADFEALDLTFEHVLAVGQLPTLHKDPFDRMLVAQARVEGLTLVTADPMMARYDVATIPA